MKKINIKNAAMDAAGLGAGAVAANIVSSKLPIENQMIKNAAPIVLGVFLSGSKGIVGNVGKGMIAAGVSRMATSYFPALAGINGPEIEEVLAGLENEVLAGNYDNSADSEDDRI